MSIHFKSLRFYDDQSRTPNKAVPSPLYIWLIYGGFFMSDVKKLRFLKPETVEKLKLCMEMAGTDAVDLMTEAYGQDVFDKKGRGDKVWLYKGAKEARSEERRVGKE